VKRGQESRPFKSSRFFEPRTRGSPFPYKFDGTLTAIAAMCDLDIRRNSSSVPPGRGVGPRENPAINRRATFDRPSGTREAELITVCANEPSFISVDGTPTEIAARCDPSGVGFLFLGATDGVARSCGGRQRAQPPARIGATLRLAPSRVASFAEVSSGTRALVIEEYPALKRRATFKSPCRDLAGPRHALRSG
jgi:hypothetical protein